MRGCDACLLLAAAPAAAADLLRPSPLIPTRFGWARPTGPTGCRIGGCATDAWNATRRRGSQCFPPDARALGRRGAIEDAGETRRAGGFGAAGAGLDRIPHRHARPFSRLPRHRHHGVGLEAGSMRIRACSSAIANTRLPQVSAGVGALRVVLSGVPQGPANALRSAC